MNWMAYAIQLFSDRPQRQFWSSNSSDVLLESSECPSIDYSPCIHQQLWLKELTELEFKVDAKTDRNPAEKRRKGEQGSKAEHVAGGVAPPRAGRALERPGEELADVGKLGTPKSNAQWPRPYSSVAATAFTSPASAAWAVWPPLHRFPPNQLTKATSETVSPPSLTSCSTSLACTARRRRLRAGRRSSVLVSAAAVEPCVLWLWSWGESRVVFCLCQGSCRSRLLA